MSTSQSSPLVESGLPNTRFAASHGRVVTDLNVLFEVAELPMTANGGDRSVSPAEIDTEASG